VRPGAPPRCVRTRASVRERAPNYKPGGAISRSRAVPRGHQRIETAGISGSATSGTRLEGTRAEDRLEAETGMRKGTNLPRHGVASRAPHGEPRPLPTRSEPAMPNRSREPRASAAIHATLTVAIAAIAAIPASAIEPCRIEDPFEPRAPDPADARYEIEGQTFTPESGCAAQPVAPPGAASALATEVFGDPVFGDLDGDGDEDAVLWLIHQPGGSGTFYYVAVAFREGSGFRGSRAALVGDRIEPGRLEIIDQRVAAHYLDRSPDQPMSAQPTIARSAQFTLTTSGLVRE